MGFFDNFFSSETTDYVVQNIREGGYVLFESMNPIDGVSLGEATKFKSYDQAASYLDSSGLNVENYEITRI